MLRATLSILVILLASFFALRRPVELLLESGRWVEWLQERESVGGLIGSGLLIADVILPIPGTVVMVALGQVYGPIIGGVFASLGSVGACLAGYGLCRLLGPGAARMLVGEKSLDSFDGFASRWGGWAIALLRPVPIIPEVLCCLAGLAAMPFRVFVLAAVSGSVPLAFLTAWLGGLGLDRPLLTLTAALVVPSVLFLPCWLLLGRSGRAERGSCDAPRGDSASGPAASCG